MVDDMLRKQRFAMATNKVFIGFSKWNSDEMLQQYPTGPYTATRTVHHQLFMLRFHVQRMVTSMTLMHPERKHVNCADNIILNRMMESFNIIKENWNHPGEWKATFLVLGVQDIEVSVYQ